MIADNDIRETTGLTSSLNNIGEGQYPILILGCSSSNFVGYRASI